MPTIIGPDQTGFIKGRYFGENARILHETIEYINNLNENGLIFFSDFNKAFDSLDHNFMRKCLLKFEFPQFIINWVNLFYKDEKSCKHNNGHLSSFFNIEKGVRQGCPLSPYLFINCIELLSNEINLNKDINGIKIGNIELKQTLFADDACFITDGEKKSFQTLVTTIENFSKVSGLKLNKDKCTVLHLGSLRNTEVNFCKDKHFNWTSKKATTLGIIFSNNSNEMLNANLSPKIKEFELCLHKWSRWKLSLLGKITVLKSFAVPKLIYPLTVLHSSDQVCINKIKKTMFQFLWDNKPDKISREKNIQDYGHGGLKMLEIDKFIKSLKCSWVKRIKLQTDSKWVQLYETMLNKYGKQFLFKSNLNSQDMERLEIKSRFLKDILGAWSYANFKDKISYFGKEFIWNNTNIKIKIKALFTLQLAGERHCLY